MSDTHDTAPNRFAEASGLKYAYRRFGKKGATPIVFLQHFRGNLDDWDPIITNSLAQEREVILFASAGVGLSTGENPDNVWDMTKHLAAFLDALDLPQADILGYSLGGFVAQQFALTYPKRARRLILAGTGPQGGVGMEIFTHDILRIAVKDSPVPDDILLIFFQPTGESQAAGRAFLERLMTRPKDREPRTSLQTRDAQLKAIQGWGYPDGTQYARLKYIRHPTMVVGGINDAMFPSINAFTLAEHLPNAHLNLYPDASHGGIMQYGDLFSQQANGFLN
jgi:pimeloyl-ACP methyl ester carboxylesterase